MLFNSIIFITVFLPIALLGWFLLQRLENPIYAKLFIVGMSFWFYGYYNLIYLWILLASIFFNFVFSILMEHTEARDAQAPVGGGASGKYRYALLF